LRCGIVVSAPADLPTGAVTVWMMALLALIVGFSIGCLRRADGLETRTVDVRE
jgi:hypothetical protein